MKTKLTLLILLLAVAQVFAQPGTRQRESYGSSIISGQHSGSRFSHPIKKAPHFKAVDPQYRLDSLVIAGYFRYAFEYDAANRIVSEIESEYDFSAFVWNYSAKTLYTYNTEGLEWKVEEFSWDGTNWVNSYKYEYEYNAQGQIVTYFDSYWEVSESIWYTTKYVQVYDASGNLSVQTSYSFESGTSSWLEQSNTTYTYNAQNQLITQIYSFYDFGTSSWVASDRNVYSYDSHGNQTLNVYEFWDSTTESWVLSYQSQSEYTYDGSGNILTLISSDWDEMTTSWMLYSKEESTYDSYGNLLTQAYYDWNGSAWEASDMQQINYNTSISIDLVVAPSWLYEEFPAHHMITGASFSQWVAVAWVPMFNAQFYYSSLISVPEAVTASVQLYPNPVKSGSELQIEGLQAGARYQLNLFDVTGKELAAYHFTGGNSISLRDLNSGMYLYRVQDAQGQSWNGKILIK